MRALLLAALVAAVVGCKNTPKASLEPSPHALLLHNVRVYGHPGANAVRVQGDRIDAIGQVDALAPAALTIDGRGGWLGPGLRDAHVHLGAGVAESLEADLSDAQSMADVVRVMRGYAASHPEVPWLRGRGWSYGIELEGRTPRAWLDTLGEQRPVLLRSYDGHAVWANSAALSTRDAAWLAKDQDVARDPRGEPTGLVVEDGMRALLDAAPEPNPAQLVPALEAQLQRWAALGIVSIDTMETDTRALDALATRWSQRRWPVRVRAFLPLDTPSAWPSWRAHPSGAPIAFVGLKGFLDGVIESKTAYLLSPYEGDTARGAPRYSPARLGELVHQGHGAGLTVALHAIGDAAVRMALDAYASLPDPAPLDHRVEHIEVLSPHDAGRFAALGVAASMQPYHANPFGEHPNAGVWARNVGPQRLPHTFAWRELLAAEAPVAFGSDWPVMSSNPWWGMAVALTRRDRQGRPAEGWNAHQTITFDQALAAYASTSLEPGARADLVLLPPGVGPEGPSALWTIDQVALTVQDGRVVHDGR